MTDVLNVLLEITVYSAVLCAVILLFQKAFHKAISAAMNYAVWGILILRLLVPVTIDSGLHLFVIPEDPIQVRQADTAASDNSVQSQTAYQPIEKTSTDTPFYTQANGTTYNSDSNIQIQPAVKIDWQTGLVLLWAAGAIGSLAYVAICRRRLNKKIERYEITTPQNVIELIDKCKRDMRVKANIRVSVQGWIKSPALSSSIRPKLLIPEQMLKSMDEKQIEFGVRHELTHYRRKDHLINYLLVILRCVYWFNPVVYFAFRRIQVDMETACDADITSGLGSSERSRYIRTMIDLGGSNIQYVIGMGICKGRKAMERRIRGIFMKRRTGRGVRTVAVVLAGIMLVACFTTACQPTPKKAAVVGKEEDLPSGALNVQTSEKPALDVLLNLPQKWSDKMDIGDGNTITVDTGIELPDTNVFPVYKLQRQELTQKELNKLINYFAPNAKFYAPGVFTKEYYEQRLIEAKRGQFVDGKYVPPPADDPGVKSIEKKLANAPEANTVTPVGTDFDYYSDGDGKVDKSRGKNFMGVNYTMPDGKNGSIYAQKYEDGKSIENTFGIKSGIDFTTQSMMENQPNITEEQRSMYPNEELAANDKTKQILKSGFFDKFTLPQDQAVQQANKTITDLGIEDMGIVNVEKVMIERSGAAGSSDAASQDQGYVVEYTRKLGAIDGFINSQTSGSSGNNDAYAPPFMMENISMVISENGIEMFDWFNMAHKVGTESEDSKLLSFKEIEGRITDQLKYRHIPGVSSEIKIDKVQLASGYINVKNDMDSVWDIPIWVVEYSIINKTNNGEDMDPSIDHLMINALDGGVVLAHNNNNY